MHETKVRLNTHIDEKEKHVIFSEYLVLPETHTWFELWLWFDENHTTIFASFLDQKAVTQRIRKLARFKALMTQTTAAHRRNRVPVRDPSGRPDLEFVGWRNVVSLTDLRIKKSQSIDDNIRRKHEFSVTEAYTLASEYSAS